MSQQLSLLVATMLLVNGVTIAIAQQWHTMTFQADAPTANYCHESFSNRSTSLTASLRMVRHPFAKVQKSLTPSLSVAVLLA